MAASLAPTPPKPPFIALVASGGHSAVYRYKGIGDVHLLGETRDDAAGEAFDKTAKLLGLGYPGGARIDGLAEQGDPTRFRLPISLRARTTYDFSFSGLKTAVRLLIEKIRADGQEMEGQLLADLCASLRSVIVEALLSKSFLACRRTQTPTLVIGGGVSANSWLRREALRLGREYDVEVFVPERFLCTDNALMIAACGRAYLQRGQISELHLRADAGAILPGT